MVVLIAGLFSCFRFDYNSMFGGKVNKQVAFSDHLDMRPFMSDKEVKKTVSTRERDRQREREIATFGIPSWL